MSRVRKIFSSSEFSQSENSIEVLCNTHREIFIQIDSDSDSDMYSWVCLDVETAIQFSKELRKSIATAKNSSDE